MLEPTKFIWMNGNFVPWNDAKVHVLTHALHYGSCCFEGIRAYKTDNGPAIFRLREHIERLFYSSSALEMNISYSVDELCNAVVELVKQNQFEQGYIRPLTYFGYGVMGLKPLDSPVDVMLACWPWGRYLTADAVDIVVSKYIRIHPQSTVGDAKIGGHYINSILATLELKGTPYHEALFLDYEGNIAEGPAENFFIIKNGEIYTPKLGAILAGITRATVIELAKDLGFKVREETITLDDAFNADEAFFTGTACEVGPIRSINDKLIGAGNVGPITSKIKNLYADVVYGREEKYKKFLTLAT